MKPWALILAAGEGSRLRTLTTTRAGVAVPKQFCSLRGGPSLLQEALQRAAAIASRGRICTIVAAQHRHWWQRPLESLSAANVIVQPKNRGTALGLLLPIANIAERDPDARIVVLPSDHHVRDEATLASALRLTTGRLRDDTDNLYLLGMDPDEPDTELGYVVPGERDSRGDFRVDRFVEKPPPSLARALIQHGGLWNTFILAGAASAFIDLFNRRYPDIVTQMREAVRRDLAEPGDAIAATELYGRLPDLDFSHHVLEDTEAPLRLIAVPACGWSDLGTPRRVAEALRRLDREQRASQPTLASTAYLNLAAQHARLRVAI